MTGQISRLQAQTSRKLMTSATLVATSVFGKMRKIWKNKCISLKVKMTLYKAIVLSILLYSAEIWPLTATPTKRLNAAQPTTDGKGASWVSPDRVTNEEVRVRTGQHSMDDILSERRLRWLGRVIRMDHQRIPRQALHWEVPGFKRGPGRWRSTVNKDLSRMGVTWQKAEVAAQNRSEWRQSVAQCIHLNTGWIKVKVKCLLNLW